MGNKPTIHHVASLWTLTGYSSQDGEWTLEQKLDSIRSAGFTGFAGRISQVTSELIENSGLVFCAIHDIGLTSDIRAELEQLKAVGSACVNVQMLDHDSPTEMAVPLAIEVLRVADDLELDVGIEVHRDTCTETPEKTYALAEGYEKSENRPMKITWDFSHPAIIKHISPPYWNRLAERVDLIQYASQFHFRPFNGHHCQISALDHDGNFTPEFLDWLPFAEMVIKTWLESATEDHVMYACPEQGPPGYALSIFPDLWKDAQAIRGELDRIWQNLTGS